MVGVNIDAELDAAEVGARALEGGLVINVPGPGMLRFLPPLIVDEAEVAEALEVLSSALTG